MTADEPSIFQNLSPYMRAKLMMASAIVFRRSNWKHWTYGHEKLLGVILWHYETKKEKEFKYNKLLKKHKVDAKVYSKGKWDSPTWQSKKQN